MKQEFKMLLWAVVIVGGLLAIVWVVNLSRSDYYAFDAQREAWHRRCDAYVGQTADAIMKNPAARQCAQELSELMAYAKRKGWQ